MRRMHPLTPPLWIRHWVTSKEWSHMHRLSHQALYTRLHGARVTRPTGSPKLRWVDNIAADVSKLGLSSASSKQRA